MNQPPSSSYTLDVTITVSFTDSVVGGIYADAPEEERRAMLLEAIDLLLNSATPPQGREPFVTYTVVRD